MKILKNITEDEVTATLFKYNYDSFRFGKKLKTILQEQEIDPKVVIDPDINNEAENKIREKLIRSFDGGDVGGYLSQDFPENISWKRALLTKEDLKKVKYIDYDYWNELSNGTRLVLEGASSIRKGVEIFKQSNQHFWNAFETLKEGKKFPEPILIARNTNADLVVVDGHLRLTVYLLDPKYTPDEIEVMLGFSEDFQSWDMY